MLYFHDLFFFQMKCGVLFRKEETFSEFWSLFHLLMPMCSWVLVNWISGGRKATICNVSQFPWYKYSHQATNMKLGAQELVHASCSTPLTQMWQRMLKNHLEISLRPAHISAWSCLPQKAETVGSKHPLCCITESSLSWTCTRQGFGPTKDLWDGKIPVGWLGPTLGIAPFGPNRTSP